MAYQSVTLATMRTRLAERWESVPFWADADADAAFNEALRWWNLLTGRFRRRTTLASVAGVPWVDIPAATLVYNARLEYNDVPMYLSSIWDLDQGRPGWQGETTATGGTVPTTTRVWAPVGLRLFAIWPADAGGGGSITVDGVRETPTLVNPGDFIDLGEEEHHAILGKALRIAAFKAGNAILASTEKYDIEFLKAAGEANSRLKASSLYRKFMGRDKARAERPLVLPNQSVQAAAGAAAPQGGTR